MNEEVLIDMNKLWNNAISLLKGEKVDYDSMNMPEFLRFRVLQAAFQAALSKERLDGFDEAVEAFDEAMGG